MKSTFLYSFMHIGSPSSPARCMLNDVCCNICLLDFDLFQQRYPGTKINSDISVSVQGIGETRSLGYVHIPIWIDGFREDNSVMSEDMSAGRCLIKIEREFHIVKDFGYSIPMGVDMMGDYGIDLHLCRERATLSGFSYEIQLTESKFRSVLVRARADIIIHEWTCTAVLVKSHMLLQRDYVFSPHQFIQ